MGTQPLDYRDRETRSEPFADHRFGGLDPNSTGFRRGLRSFAASAALKKTDAK